jgi:hypothetical protein
VEPSQSNLTQRLLENGRPAEANLNLDEDDDGPPNLSKRRRVVPSDDEASGDEGRRLESAAGSQVDAGGEDGDGDGDGDGRGASEPRGQPDSGEDGDNGSVGSEVRSQAGDGGDDGGEQSDRNKVIFVHRMQVGLIRATDYNRSREDSEGLNPFEDWSGIPWCFKEVADTDFVCCEGCAHTD